VSHSHLAIGVIRESCTEPSILRTLPIDEQASHSKSTGQRAYAWSSSNVQNTTPIKEHEWLRVSNSGKGFLGSPHLPHCLPAKPLVLRTSTTRANIAYRKDCFDFPRFRSPLINRTLSGPGLTLNIAYGHTSKIPECANKSPPK